MKIVSKSFLYAKIKMRQVINEYKKKQYKKSFSQYGEDLIVKTIFELLNIKNPTFLDIGAHHPYYLSNTALFYNSGSHGINVEANPFLIRSFNYHRKRDVNLNVGIGVNKGKMLFHVFEDDTLSTFSENEAQKLKAFGHKCIKERSIEIISINELLHLYNSGKAPDFLTIDAEGYDFQILNSLDFEKFSPAVICIEIVEYSPNGNGKKKQEIINLLNQEGYVEYANTYINGIFVNRSVFERIGN
jgi:FkbM family methyltransferase